MTDNVDTAIEEQMAQESAFVKDIVSRVLANRALPVAFAVLTQTINEISQEVTKGAQEFMATDLERLALHIRNLPQEQTNEVPVGSTVN